MSIKPNFTKGKSVSEWTLDDHYRDNIESAIQELMTVRDEWENGEVTLHTVKRLAWVQDWTASTQRAMIESMFRG